MPPKPVGSFVASRENQASVPQPNSPSSSAVGAVLLIAQQFGSRGLTFIVNQILLRYLSPELLGISTQLEVYSITVLFFARESLRVAIQRHDDTSSIDSEEEVKKEVPKGYVNGRTGAGRTQAIVNLAYISVLLGLIFAFLVGRLYLGRISARDPSVLGTPYFYESLWVYGLASVWEILAEPCYVVVQQKSRFGIRAGVESAATVLRCLLTCGFTVYASRTGVDTGVLPFALGQGIYALSLFVGYHWCLRGVTSTQGFSLLPKRILSSGKSDFLFSYFSKSLLTLGRSFFLQSIFKHVLTQGDTILVGSLATQRVQGVYALANNYGGLVARLILQPVEEMSRNYFGKLLSSSDQEPSKPLVLKALKTLTMLLRTYAIFSLCIVSVGPTVAPLLLKFVAGSRWTAAGAGSVLSVYCYYIPLLAFNGLAEAFVSSVATEVQIHRQTIWMLAFSAGFAGAVFVFLRVLDLGAAGLVWANAFNMLCRILWCSAFIHSYLKRYSLNLSIRTISPRSASCAAAIGTITILRQFESTFLGGFADFLKSGAVSACLLLIVGISEREHFIECYSELRGSKQGNQ